MLKTGTAEKSTPAKGIFRDFDGATPSGRLFRQEEPAAGRTERYHVSAANDPEEISAERTADRVMGGGSLFRAADGPGLEGGEAELPSADLSEPGSALPAGLQESMGESIGADFSGVRVHTGAGADRASRSLSARAFARGQDLYFREGEYNPDSQEGQHLIAHELAHVADGADGLHRAYTAPEFPDSGNVPTAAEEKQIINCTTTVLRTVRAANVDKMEEKYLNSPLEENKPSKEDQEKLRDAKQALDSAEGYIQKLDVCLADTGLSASSRSMLEAQKSRLSDALTQREKIEKILGQVDPALSRMEDMPLSDSVKNMLESPYFDQFFRAASQIQKAGKSEAFGAAEESAAENAGSANVKMSAEKKRNYIQHQNELKGVNAGTGLQDVKDRSNKLEKTGKVFSALGESGAEVSEGVGEVGSAAITHKEHKKIDGDESLDDEGKEKAKEAADKDAGEKGDAIKNIASGAAEGLGAIGTGLSAAQSSKDAEAQRKQDQRAKQSMKNISSQLESTLPANLADGALSGDDAARTRRIQKVCQQVKQDKVNDDKVPLSQLIADAMDESPELKPELTGKQKRLLSTLQALETSRASSKDKAEKLRKDAIFGSFDAISAGLKSVGGIVSGIGSLLGSTAGSLAGAILSLVGSIIGQVSAIRGKVSEEDEGGEEDEQAKKMAACRSAVQQMAGLPPMRDKAVEALKKKAGGDTAQKVGSKTMESAEQYAAAFYTIESANVNMSDILFAIEKGEFGKGAGTENAKSTEDSLKDMYANLSFS